MPILHLPVLIWADAAGGHTAALVGDFDEAAAHASTPQEALQQLKDLLAWRQENESWNVDPDFKEPALLRVKVEVLPQYRQRKRIIPCPESVWLQVPCVTGVQENGLRVCCVPHLGLRFNYSQEASVKSLAAHYIKEELQGVSPLGLAQRLPPDDCRLEEIVFRDEALRSRTVPPENRPELKTLFALAEPWLRQPRRKGVTMTAYGREALVAALARKMGKEKANVLLVGESGVGKSLLLLEALKKVVREQNANAPDAEDDVDRLNSYRYWRGNGGRIIAGMQYLGEWEERCEKFIRQLNAIEGVFCAENLLDLIRVGGDEPGDSIASFLLPFLRRKELRVVAEATPTELEACRRLLPGLLDMFQIFPVPALNHTEAHDVLQRLAATCVSAVQGQVAPGVPALVQRLFERFLPHAVMPGPAASFVRQLCERRSPAESTEVAASDVIALFLKQTGLPERFLRDDLPLPVEEVRQQLGTEIIGQPQAVLAAAHLVAKIKAGLVDPGRPCGVMLFCGPTGVGKTALAQSLARFCFGAGGQKDRLVRLDMSEYSGWGAARRLLHGAYGGTASWIERVQRQPFCVLLLDEIEKAAPEVFDALLGVLDEGRLTDPFGRVAHFRCAIIIMTSNLGASATAISGFGAMQPAAYEAEAAKFFRPEFFNRLDAVVTFNPLNAADIEKIVRKELAELASREGFAGSGLQLVWTEELVQAVARTGYDPQLGARPLQRALEQMVSVPLARWKVAHPGARKLKLAIGLGPANRAQIEIVTP